MESSDILEILKYTIPSLVLFALTYALMRQYLSKEINLRKLELRLANLRETKPVRLQAYERMALFLERVAMQSLLRRVLTKEMNVRAFQMALLANIRQEFDHNITQQIYVSPECWGLVRAAKEETISTINRIAASLPPEAPGLELSKRVIAHQMDQETEGPTGRALLQIKREVIELF